MYMYVSLNHYSVHLKLTQHCVNCKYKQIIATSGQETGGRLDWPQAEMLTFEVSHAHLIFSRQIHASINVDVWV